MALFPIKQTAAAHERLYPNKESPLCRGSSGWEVNAKGCSKCCVSCRMSRCLSLQELLRFPFHSHLGRNTWCSCGRFWSPVMGEIAAVLVNCVEQKFLKSSSRPGSLHCRDKWRVTRARAWRWLLQAVPTLCSAPHRAPRGMEQEEEQSGETQCSF